MREWRTFSRFPCTAKEYYALMVDGAFQERLHVDGLKMGCWDFEDARDARGVLRSRVAFSEPRLNLPAIIERLARRAQSYHEHTTYTPSECRRFVRVVPCVGAESMDFTFDEWVRDDVDGVGGCVCESIVRVAVKGGWIGRILERFICSTSKVKLSERDAWLHAKHFAPMGYRRIGFDDFEPASDSIADADAGAAAADDDDGDVPTVTLSFRGGGSGKKKSGKGEGEWVGAADLSAHPLPPSAFRRSGWKNFKSKFASTKRKRVAATAA